MVGSYPEGRGAEFVRAVADPGAGNNVEIQHVVGWIQRIWGFAFGYGTDATVADRYVFYRIRSVTHIYNQYTTTIAQPASISATHSVSSVLQGTSLTIGWNFMHPWHPEYLISGLTYIEVGAVNMVAGDVFVNIFVIGEEWIDD